MPSGTDITNCSTVPERVTYRRHLPPAHYSMKIKSFSLVPKSINVDKYESGLFEAGGYKWRLCLYPDGDDPKTSTGYIALYLSIDETNKLPPDWEVDVTYRLFVYDKIRDNYLVIQDGNGAVRSFHDLKTQWGFSQFLSLETFQKASNGYLAGDSCIFGAEVFVIKSTGRSETLTMIKDPPNKKFVFNMDSFSKRDQSSYYSDTFTVPLGESSWRLLVYPEGNNSRKGRSLSVYLKFDGSKDLPPESKVYRKCTLRVLDQLFEKHMERTMSRWVTKSDKSWGFDDFMSLEDLRKPAKGFLYNDLVLVEVEFLVVSVAKVV